MLIEGVDMRKYARIPCIALLVLSAPAAFADEWTKTFAVPAEADLRIEVSDGAVTVRSWDRKEISARVTTQGWKIGPLEVRITDHQAANRVELDVRVPRMNLSFSRHSVRVELQVPRELHAEIRSGDGRISVQDVKGEIRLSSSDGSIEADSVDGILEAKTGDGRIRASGRWDRIDLRTNDGSIEAEARAGSKMTSGWQVHTGDGHVTLRLPESFAADLDAHTGDGKITVDFPVTMSGASEGSAVRGRLNGGGATLMVRTGDGPIKVMRL
jgi:DUF4097 and DUF4098 domain-containing protein YvlB